jgi:hypothetical protein
MNTYMMLQLCTLLPLVLGCPSAIDYMKPPICTPNSLITPLGEEKTYEYANMLFGNTHNILDETQRECILQGPTDIQRVIRTCIDDLTMNENTIPHKVARGLAQNQDDEWVSACAENMPCIEFNQYVYNQSFTNLVSSCNATEIFTWLFNKTHFIESSWYGVKYCQMIDPVHCMYREKDSCSETDHIYACAVSKWIYASNFMLFYILSPEIAARLPGCRIIS